MITTAERETPIHDASHPIPDVIRIRYPEQDFAREIQGIRRVNHHGLPVLGALPNLRYIVEISQKPPHQERRIPVSLGQLEPLAGGVDIERNTTRRTQLSEAEAAKILIDNFLASVYSDN